jgi:hypothetical protein
VAVLFAPVYCIVSVDGSVYRQVYILLMLPVSDHNNSFVLPDICILLLHCVCTQNTHVDTLFPIKYQVLVLNRANFH